MSQDREKQYYVVTQNAIPEVLLKVVEVKRLLAGKPPVTVSEATAKVGLSRSSFYKYKDDIFEFHENALGKTVTFVLEILDEPGLLSDVLRIIAQCGANILTIHQSIPINGLADISLSIELKEDSLSLGDIVEEMRLVTGIHEIKIVARE